MSKKRPRVSGLNKIKNSPRFQISLFIILTGALIVLGYYILTSYACSQNNGACEEQKQNQIIQNEAAARCVTILWIFKICF